MKKIITAFLALSMVASMSITAFAQIFVPATEDDLLIQEGEFLFADNIYSAIGISLSRWGVVDSNEVVPFDFNNTQIDNSTTFESGTKIATAISQFELPEGMDISELPQSIVRDIRFYFFTNYNMRNADIKNWRVSAEWQDEDTADLVESIKIEPLAYTYSITPTPTPPQLQTIADIPMYIKDVHYFVTIEFSKDVENVDMSDLVGKLTLYKGSKANANEELQVLQVNGDNYATVGYDEIEYGENGFEEIEVEGSGIPVRNFDDAENDDTATFDFNGVGTFTTGRLGSENPKYLAFNSDINQEMINAYPSANLDFVNFPGKVNFNHFGSFELYAEEGQYVYAVVNGELKTLEDIARFNKVVVDEDNNSLIFSIKNFPDGFVYSDTELEIVEATVEEAVAE